MNFKKMNKSKPTNDADSKAFPQLTDLKMVKVTILMPMWAKDTFETIDEKFECDHPPLTDGNVVIEESEITLADLEQFHNNCKYPNEYFLSTWNKEYTIKDIIKNIKKKK